MSRNRSNLGLPDFGFGDIRHCLGERTLIDECTRAASGFPRDIVESASSSALRAVEKQAAQLEAAASVAIRPALTNESLSVLKPAMDASVLCDTLVEQHSRLVSGSHVDEVIRAASSPMAREIERQASQLGAAAAYARQSSAVDSVSAFGPQFDASETNTALPSRHFDAVAAGYAEDASRVNRLAQEWANSASVEATRGFERNLESLRSVIDRPHREALDAIEALRRQIAAPAEQIARAVAGGSVAEAYIEAQSRVRDLATDYARAAQDAYSGVSAIARQSLQNPLAEAAKQLRELWTGLEIDAIARWSSLRADMSAHLSALAEARATWDTSFLSSAGLTATEGMAIQLLRTPPRAKSRTKKGGRSRGKPRSEILPPTTAGHTADDATLDDRRANSGLFAEKSTPSETQHWQEQLWSLGISSRARILRAAQQLTPRAFSLSVETPFLALGPEIAAITLEFLDLDPFLGKQMLATWQQITAWDGIFSAAEGIVRLGGAESIEDADVRQLRDCMIELSFLIDCFESLKNSGR